MSLSKIQKKEKKILPAETRSISPLGQSTGVSKGLSEHTQFFDIYDYKNQNKIWKERKQEKTKNKEKERRNKILLKKENTTRLILAKGYRISSQGKTT